MSKFEVGDYKLYDEYNDIEITKRTPKYIYLHIKEYYGDYELRDRKVKKYIYKDDNDNEYIKPIHFQHNTIFTPSKDVLNGDYGFSSINLKAIDLEKINDKEIIDEANRRLEFRRNAVKEFKDSYKRNIKLI